MKLFSGLGILLLFVLPSGLFAEVIVSDQVSVKDKPVMLKAQTKERFFSEGGVLVEFLVDGKSLGKNLSGGDGYAFKEYIPREKGLHKIIADSRGDKGKGLLLSLEKGEGIVFIDIEGSMIDASDFPPKARKESHTAVRALAARFPIVYLATGTLNEIAGREWIEDHGFPESAVLSWDEGGIFQEVTKKGLAIKAVIGNPAVIESLKKYKPKAFSFEEVKGAQRVKKWDEIQKKLK